MKRSQALENHMQQMNPENSLSAMNDRKIQLDEVQQVLLKVDGLDSQFAVVVFEIAESGLLFHRRSTSFQNTF